MEFLNIFEDEFLLEVVKSYWLTKFELLLVSWSSIGNWGCEDRRILRSHNRYAARKKTEDRRILRNTTSYAKPRTDAKCVH